jgi:hypothetical protein
MLNIWYIFQMAKFVEELWIAMDMQEKKTFPLEVVE